MEQRPPSYFNMTDKSEETLKSLGLSENDLITNAPISIINTGNSFAIIPVSSSEVLRGLKPDFELITKISEELGLIGYYVFCLQTEDEERDANARMFAPRYGIYEEAGTGMAAGPLACYLHDILDLKKDQYLIQQGLFMMDPSPSLIQVELQTLNGKISKILAGGKGILKETRSFEI